MNSLLDINLKIIILIFNSSLLMVIDFDDDKKAKSNNFLKKQTKNVNKFSKKIILSKWKKKWQKFKEKKKNLQQKVTLLNNCLSFCE